MSLRKAREARGITSLAKEVKYKASPSLLLARRNTQYVDMDRGVGEARAEGSHDHDTQLWSRFKAISISIFLQVASRMPAPALCYKSKSCLKTTTVNQTVLGGYYARDFAQNFSLYEVSKVQLSSLTGRGQWHSLRPTHTLSIFAFVFLCSIHRLVGA
jgi:hypothetical protein